MAQKKKKKKKRSSGGFKRLLPYLLIILIAAALIAAVIWVTGRQGINDQKTPTAVELDKTTPSDEQNSHQMSKNSNAEIQSLVQRYLEGLMDADVDSLAEISDISYDKASLEAKAEYTESYRNISYYVIPGLLDNTYIVYVYYEMKIVSIDSALPSLTRLYVVKDSDGQLCINMRNWSDEVAAYINEVSNWQEVIDLRNEVNNKLEELRETDENVRAFLAYLEGETTEADSAADQKVTSEEEKTSAKQEMIPEGETSAE